MYEFYQETRLSAPIDEVFEFFSNAQNLERITPKFLNFRILTPTPVIIKKGTLIDYRIRIHGIPMRWRTRISAWDPPYRFVDEQLKGPYRSWIHEHTFERADAENATIMRDRVRYSILFGRLAHFMVKKDINSIFRYRTEVIRSIFGEKGPIQHKI